MLLAGPAPAAPARPDLAAVVRRVVDQTNELRTRQGLAPTAVDATLSATARAFAVYMASTDRYGHEADGRSPAQRAQAHGYAYCSLSENIAYLVNSAGYTTDSLARGMVDGWENSPGHRRNMLDVDAVEIGVAVARSAKSQRYYAVQMFGRPRSKTIRFRIANASPVELRYALGDQPFGLAPTITRTHAQCSSAKLTLGSGADAQALTPENGARYRFERAGDGRYRLRPE